MSSFGLAVNRCYRQEDDTRAEVHYVNRVALGRQAETVGAYLRKRKRNFALVESRLQEYSGETDGSQRSRQHEVIANPAYPSYRTAAADNPMKATLVRCDDLSDIRY